MKQTFKCYDCKQEKPINHNGGVGYGVYGKSNRKVCYDCCAERDKKYMRKHGAITLYLVNKEVTNWPGTLRIPLNNINTGRHNIAGVRRDVWFFFEGKRWHGTNYGEMSELTYCKQVK